MDQTAYRYTGPLECGPDYTASPGKQCFYAHAPQSVKGNRACLQTVHCLRRAPCPTPPGALSTFSVGLSLTTIVPVFFFGLYGLGTASTDFLRVRLYLP